MKVVTFLTDFGLEDEFVGVCHGVIEQIAPGTRVIDINHGIRPQAVLQGALSLANALPYMPVGVHRRAVALRGSDGRLYVGPDNGLLVVAAERLGGIDAAHELTNRELWLEHVSWTFHARDIFSPVAAHLASGRPLEDVGPAVEPSTLVRIDLPEPTVREGLIVARCLSVDRFGNVALPIRYHPLPRRWA